MNILNAIYFLAKTSLIFTAEDYIFKAIFLNSKLYI